MSASAQSVHEVVARALDAYDALTALGEDVEDEWTYVTELSEAWRTRLEDIDASRASDIVAPAVVTAVDALAEEVSRIGDPHRAIDWLSTFPQVVLIALGEQP